MVHNEILLVETSIFPLEASTIIQLFCYLKKSQSMKNHHWPKLIMEEMMDKRKNTWMKKKCQMDGKMEC